MNASAQTIHSLVPVVSPGPGTTQSTDGNDTAGPGTTQSTDGNDTAGQGTTQSTDGNDTAGPGTAQSTDGNDTVIIVSAAIGGSVLLLALVLCFIVIWCCLIKNNPKRVHLRRTRHNNYKGNSPYVLPYTIYGM